MTLFGSKKTHVSQFHERAPVLVLFLSKPRTATSDVRIINEPSMRWFATRHNSSQSDSVFVWLTSIDHYFNKTKTGIVDRYPYQSWVDFDEFIVCASIRTKEKWEMIC